MKTIIIIVCLFIAWLLFWQLPVNGWHYEISQGEHTGYITAVEKNGIFWKTPRVYLKTELESSQEDQYCVVAEEELLGELKEASINKERVTVEFSDWLIRGAKYCGGAYEVAVIKSIK